MKVVIHISSFTPKQIEEVLGLKCNDLIYLIFSKKSELENWKKKIKFSQNIACFVQKDILNLWEDHTVPTEDDLTTMVQMLLNDHQTLMFLDRFQNKKSVGSGVNNFTRYIARFALAYYRFFKLHLPDAVYFRSSPHQIESWITAFVAEYTKVPVLISERSVVPWRRYIVRGLHRHREICVPDKLFFAENGVDETQRLGQYIINKQKSYEHAIPDYERKRLERNRGKIYSFKNELVYWWKRPDYILNKYRCYQAHKRLSITIDFAQPFIVFFLHYQPERTTLPEGFGFAQQILAISALRAATPLHIAIIVKEHPSTFTNRCETTQRHPSFYEDISALRGVFLSKIEINSYALLDSALAVATITGTVGVEALLRGKPAIFFGRTSIANVHGCHAYQNLDELKKFISSCSNEMSAERIVSEIVHFMKESFLLSVPDGKPGKSRKEDTAEFKMLRALIQGKVNVPFYKSNCDEG
jgi:hypothetical protein